MEIPSQPTDAALPPQGPRPKEFTLNREQFSALVGFCSETGRIRSSVPDRAQGRLMVERNARSLMEAVTRFDPKDPANKGIIASHCAAALGATSNPDSQGQMLTFLASTDCLTPNDIQVLGQYRQGLNTLESTNLDPGRFTWDHINLTNGILTSLQKAEQRGEPNDGLMLAVLSMAASSALNYDAGSSLIGIIQKDFVVE